MISCAVHTEFLSAREMIVVCPPKTANRTDNDFGTSVCDEEITKGAHAGAIHSSGDSRGR